MANALWSSKGYWIFFEMNAALTGIVPAGGGTVISTPAISDAAIVLKEDGEEACFQTDWTPDAAGIYTAVVKSSHLGVPKFLDRACPAKKGAASGVVKKEYTTETGTKLGGANSSGGVNYLVINATAYNDTLVCTNMAFVNVSRESDKTSAVAGDMQMRDLKVTTVAAKEDFEIPNVLFTNTIWDISPEITDTKRTLVADIYFLSENLAIAA